MGRPLIFTNAAYYLVFTCAVERRKDETGDPAYLLANTLVLFFVVLASKPFGGWLSDKVGRRRLMLALTVAMLAAVYLSLRLMLYGSPFVSTFLIKTFGNPIVPAYYIMLYGFIGLAIMLPMKETNTRALDA